MDKLVGSDMGLNHKESCMAAPNKAIEPQKATHLY
jgi:hypothetical protein